MAKDLDKIVFMSKKNRKNPLKSQGSVEKKYKVPFVVRPFEGLKFEADFVAMRELVPAGTITAQTNDKYGKRDVTFVSLLPNFAQAVVNSKGKIMVALQTQINSGDPSHDLGLILEKALNADNETVITGVDVRQPAPRLQEMLNNEYECVAQVHEDCSFWFDEKIDDENIAKAIENSRENIIPTKEIAGVKSAYWCKFNKEFIRWVLTDDEREVYNALARLKVEGLCDLGEGSKFAGAFRGLGLIVPVWEVAEGMSFEDTEKAMQKLASNMQKQLANLEPLTDEQKRARAGLVSRQVSLR